MVLDYFPGGLGEKVNSGVLGPFEHKGHLGIWKDVHLLSSGTEF